MANVSIKIPENISPWTCDINGVKYGPYKSGDTVSVPDFVAFLIQNGSDKIEEFSPDEALSSIMLIADPAYPSDYTLDEETYDVEFYKAIVNGRKIPVSELYTKIEKEFKEFRVPCPIIVSFAPAIGESYYYLFPAYNEVSTDAQTGDESTDYCFSGVPYGSFTPYCSVSDDKAYFGYSNIEP